MKSRIIAIGNSKGIRLPKPIIEDAGLSDVVEVTVENSSVVIRPIRSPRAGWEEAFANMAERGDDTLLDADAPPLTSWDKEEWQWK